MPTVPGMNKLTTVLTRHLLSLVPAATLAQVFEREPDDEVMKRKIDSTRRIDSEPVSC